LQRMSDVTRRNSESSERVAANTEELHGQAAIMLELVDTFRLTGRQLRRDLSPEAQSLPVM